MLESIEHWNGLDDRRGLGDRARQPATGSATATGMATVTGSATETGHHDSTYARAHRAGPGCKDRGRLTVPVKFDRPFRIGRHRDEDDGLTNSVKIGCLYRH